MGYRSVSPFSDLELYQECARLINGGSWPYRDFSIEYPPLAVPFFVAPDRVASWLRSRFGGFEAYKIAYVLEMLGVDALAVALVIRHVVRTEGVGRVAERLVWYTAYFVILCPLDVTRFDLVPMLAAFAAAVAFSEQHLNRGAVVAGLGVLTKLIPGLVILPWLAGSLPRAERGRAALHMNLVVGFVVTVWFLVGGDKSVDSIRYHLEREIEINTLYASGYMLAHAVGGLKLQSGFGHGSLNVSAWGSAALARWAVLVQGLCLGLVAWQAYRGRQPYSIRLAGAAILAYMIGGKVLSPQYMIWLIPFATVIPAGRWVYLGACLLTTLVYPWMYGALANFGQVASAVLLLRNVALIWLFVIWLRAEPSVTPSESRASAPRGALDDAPAIL